MPYRTTALRRFALALMAAWIGVLMSACAGLVGPRTYTFSEADLTRLIERQFPFDKRMLEVLDVRVDTPRVHLLPQQNRVATELDVRASERLFGRSLQGSLALDYALRYDESDQSVKLSDVRVQRLDIAGLAQPLAARLAPLLAEQLLNDLPIHRFKPEQVQAAAALGLKPGKVTVTDRGVEVALGVNP